MLLKQICQSVGLFIKNTSKTRVCLKLFIMNFKYFVHFLFIGLTEYFLAVPMTLLRELNAMRLSVCKVKLKQCLLGRKTS